MSTPASNSDDVARLERQLDFQAAQIDELTQTFAFLLEGVAASPYVHRPPFGPMPDPSGRAATVLGFTGRAQVDERDAYRVFEDLFRGPAERVLELQRPYLPLLRGNEPVLDVGCGRGEFLTLLRDEDIEAHGVDLDEGMVAAARADGHETTCADVVEHLGEQEEGTLGSIFAAQVIEHLPYRALREYMHVSLRALRPGGVWIAETVNPHRPASLKCFWTDLTHQHPIFPEVALAYSWITGFDSAYLFFPTGTGDAETDRQQADAYSVVARKGSA